MGVPVYLFTGFLESGKTTLIKDTLIDEGFNTGEKTALIVCEEGEEEYEKSFLKKTNTILYEVENLEDLNYNFFKEIACKEEVDRVMIEFNGVWDFTKFLDTLELPMDWMLVQILSTVDASKFDIYVSNMKSMIFDQLRHSEVVIFNRCDENVDKLYLRNNIKAFNKIAQVIYEDLDGNVSALGEGELPFDVTKDEIEINDDDYGLWYMDAMEHPEKYQDKTLIVKGKVVSNVVKGIPRAMVIGRYAMVCCADDTSLIGLLVHYSKASSLIKDDWVKVKAQVQVEYDDEYGHDVPILYAKEVTLCEGLEDEYVYFN